MYIVRPDHMDERQLGSKNYIMNIVSLWSSGHSKWRPTQFCGFPPPHFYSKYKGINSFKSGIKVIYLKLQRKGVAHHKMIIANSM